MINHIYQLVSPRVFSVKYADIDMADKVIIRPKYMALCHADQRYYQGKRDAKILKKKLPMALVHECCGEVIWDPSGQFERGELVVPIPNVPSAGNEHIYENYRKGAKFLSSGYDGFMREYVDMPCDRVVSAKGVPTKVAAISEFVSVASHAVSRFMHVSHEERTRIGIWGDGGLAYCVAAVLQRELPESEIIVLGKHRQKLSFFSFVQKTYETDSIPEDFYVDHAFECCGGDGSEYAIDDIIKYIKPQGTVILMGVSENRVAVNTRDTLEKGLSIIGCSRSGRKDFEKAVTYMRDQKFCRRLEMIICEEKSVKTMDDLHRVFENDMHSMFKTVFEWAI